MSPVSVSSASPSSALPSSSAGPAASGTASGASAASAGASSGSSPSPSPRPAESPSATVTLSDRALTALHRDDQAPSSGGTSVYESLKSGIEGAVDDVENAVSDGAHWVADGVVSAVATVDRVVHGIADLPFVAISKTCDAIGSVLDAI